MMLPPPCFTVGMLFFRWWEMFGFHQTWSFLFLASCSRAQEFMDWFSLLQGYLWSLCCPLCPVKDSFVPPWICGFQICSHSPDLYLSITWSSWCLFISDVAESGAFQNKVYRVIQRSCDTAQVNLILLIMWFLKTTGRNRFCLRAS